MNNSRFYLKTLKAISCHYEQTRIFFPSLFSTRGKECTILQQILSSITLVTIVTICITNKKAIPPNNAVIGMTMVNLIILLIQTTSTQHFNEKNTNLKLSNYEQCYYGKSMFFGQICSGFFFFSFSFLQFYRKEC